MILQSPDAFGERQQKTSTARAAGYRRHGPFFCVLCGGADGRSEKLWRLGGPAHPVDQIVQAAAARRGAAGKLGLPVGPGAVEGAHAAVFYEQKALREPFGETAVMCDDEQRPLPAGQEPFERLQRI